MNKIETKILNCSAVREAERNMVFAARLTQRGHMIHSMDDLVKLYEKSFLDETVKTLGQLPHPAIQIFTVITVAVVGASLQYSNYSGEAEFAVPYEILTASPEIQMLYEDSCRSDLDCYGRLCREGIGHDAAGYATPQGLRNILIISATPYQWKHMIGQRSCRRNTDETRIVMLRVWKELYEYSNPLFAPALTGPYCQRDKCLEGKMSCGHPISRLLLPHEILHQDYPYLTGGETE